MSENIQIRRLESELKDLDVRRKDLKNRIDDYKATEALRAKEAALKTEPAKQTAGKSNFSPRTINERLTENLAKGEGGTLLTKYGAKIGPPPTRMQDLKVDHADLQLLDGLLEIRKSIEGGGQFTNGPRIDAIRSRIYELMRMGAY